MKRSSDRGPRPAPWPKTKLALGLLGCLVAQSPYWFGTARIDLFVVVLAALAVVPYAGYVAAVRTPAGILAGGIALVAMPTVAYADFLFDSEAGANFAPATVPLLNLVILAAALLVDVALKLHSASRSKRPSTEL